MSTRAQDGTRVTAWFAWDNRRQGYSFNHIEDGLSLADTPADPFNRRWARNRWERRPGVLSGTGPFGGPVLSLDGPPVPLLLDDER